MGEQYAVSIAKFLKWMFIVVSIPLFIQAFQGLINQETATGSPRGVGELVIGQDATALGWNALGSAAICLIISLLIWYFWERNED